MVKKPLSQAVRPLASLRSASAPHSTRQFSSTVPNGARRIFTENEKNSQLNEVLNEIQTKIILPARLPEKQRKIIFQPHMSGYLQQNPIIIELDGLEHRFSTIDRFSELPNSKKIFNKALGLMEWKEDFENLPTLLVGYRKAGIKLSPAHYSKMIRAAGRKGQIYSIVECAKQRSHTEFKLTDDAHVIQILDFITQEQPSVAVSLANIILSILEKQGSKEINPLVFGQVLYAQALAVQARQKGEGGYDAELSRFVDSAELLSRWWTRHLAESDGVPGCITDLTPYSQESKDNASLSGIEWVRVLAQNIQALQLCKQIISGSTNEPTHSPEIEQMHKIIGKAINDLEPAKAALDSLISSFIEKAGPRYRDTWAQAHQDVLTGQRPKWWAERGSQEKGSPKEE